ncbi:MAG: hypothetical protein B7Z08_01465 [Sphingomonadales bacterium 32-68-7]|nr:MAG: hypothetical protein B7Z33_08800 [Sphingomonadales bacterium 12-68-11]OYX10382.1 MAG: hypothetical protein B7Z08_01465 [Sphingomonadales bacterium 32-68-7]
MTDSTRESDAILAEARRSLAVQQDGGFHRRKGTSIGRGSADLKAWHLAAKLTKIFAATVVIVVGAGIIGAMIGGLGFGGLMITALAIAAAVVTLGAFPRMKPPKRADLNRGDVRQMVARTELWLEHQRPALPPPAVTLIDQIGVQLDALGIQLENVDPAHPAALETRKLVGETLPGMVEAYCKIPAQLRREERAGSTPDQQIVASLGKISAEIDSVTRQLADGALDDLAIQTRYLDYRYGAEGEPAALPAPARQDP